MPPVSFAVQGEFNDAGEFVGFREIAGGIVRVLEDCNQRADAAQAIMELETWLQPSQDVERLSLRLSALLEHWRTPERDEDIATIIAADWLRVMGQYPDHVVFRACEAWLEVEMRKPTIADIRRLCDDAVRTPRLHLRILRRMMEWRPN